MEEEEKKEEEKEKEEEEEVGRVHLGGEKHSSSEQRHTLSGLSLLGSFLFLIRTMIMVR